MELNRYLEILNRRKWIIFVTAAVTLAVVALSSYMMTPTYTASTVLRVAPQDGIDSNYIELSYQDRLMSTYVELVKSAPFMAEVIGRLQLQRDPSEVSRAVKMSPVGTTQLIRIDVDGADPVQAAAIANVLADLLIEQESRESRIVVVEPAGVPRAPTKPRLVMNLLLGAVIGLIIGVGLGLVFENLDHTIHSAQELQAAVSVPLLGRIPGFRRGRRSRRAPALLHGGREQAAAAEAFNALSINVISRAQAAGMRTLLVTSAEARAGRSTVAANLAAGIARAGCRVIVVDGDLLNPAMHEVLGLRSEPGLSDVVTDPGRLVASLQDAAIPGLRVLARGSAQDRPVGILNMAVVAPLLNALADQADMIIWDSGPLLATAEAAALAHLVDGVLLVAFRDQTTGEHVNLALQRLSLVGATVLGLVFNRALPDSLHDHTRHDRPGAGPALLDVRTDEGKATGANARPREASPVQAGGAG